jgi:hypothetical protein
VPLDPQTFPTAHAYLERFATTLLTRFHGLLALLVLVMLMALAPVVNRVVTNSLSLAGAALWRAIRDRRPPGGRSTSTRSSEAPSGPSDHQSGASGSSAARSSPPQETPPPVGDSSAAPPRAPDGDGQADAGA